MVSKAQADKAMRLMALEAWARAHFSDPKKWVEDPSFLKAMEEYALITWALSDSGAANYARIVQLRMTRSAPAPVPPKMLPVDEEASMSITEMIAAHRAANPEEYQAPKTDFQIIEEEATGEG